MKFFIQDSLKFFLRSINYLWWFLFSKKIEKSCSLRKVLIINLAFIGDLLAITPLVSILKKNHVSVDVMVLPEMSQLLEGNKGICKILTFNKEKGLDEGIRVYDSIILIHPNSRLFVEGLNKGGAKNIISDIPSSLNGFYSRRLSNVKKPYFSESKHKVLQNLEFARMVGLSIGSINRGENPMRLVVKKEDPSAVTKKFNLKKFIIISPGSRSQKRLGVNFPSVPKFARVADMIVKEYGLSVVLVGSKNERKVCQRITTHSLEKKKIINLAGKTTIKELSSLVLLSELVIGVDSGIIHIAAALNKKVISISRQSQRQKWHPWLDKGKYITLCKGENLDKVSYEMLKESIAKLMA